MCDIHAIVAESIKLQLELSELLEKLARHRVIELQSSVEERWRRGHFGSSYLEKKKAGEVETERLRGEIRAKRERLCEIMLKLDPSLNAVRGSMIPHGEEDAW